MNLNDFERHFDRGVLERGRPYYEDGSVTSLELQDGAWLASVEGTYDYEVSVVLSDKGEIMETSCDCPFDMDRYCKHQAAVLYALRDRLAAGKGKKKEGKKESIRGVLEKQDKESLISIIMDIAGKDKGVKEGILLRYSEKGDITGYARGVVQGAIAAAETDGYVRYGDGRKAVKGAKSVLKMAADKVGSGDAESAVSLCIVVLDELIRLVSHCDDSDGCIGGVASDAWTTIEEALSLRPPQDYGGGVFDAILEHALGPVHDSWGDWRDNLLFILVPLCAVRANRDKMETYLSSRYVESPVGWDQKYGNNQVELLRYEIVRAADGDQAADSYADGHPENRYVRIAAIESAIQRGMCDRALELCAAGERAEADNRIYMSEYKKLRYEACSRMGDADAERRLGLDMLAAGKREYYPKMKALHSKEEWPAVLQGVLGRMLANGQRDLYAGILVKEGLKPQLLEYCKGHESQIVKFHPQLLPDYKDEVCRIFASHIRRSAAGASGRGEYRYVCGCIASYREACGGPAANSVRDELKRTYARRPAFQDELGRV